MEHNLLLIVDDEAHTRNLLLKQTTDMGFKSFTATDGISALNIISTLNPCLVLLKLRLSGKTGGDVLSEIVESYPEIGVILIADEMDARKGLDLIRKGAVDCITKPLEAEIMAQSINYALSKREKRAQSLVIEKELKKTIQEQTEIIREGFMNSIKSLVYALESKDEYTQGHSLRVSNIASSIGEAVGLKPPEIAQVRFAALVHDIGIIGIRESVLNSPNKLTSVEMDHVKTHCLIGEHILKPVVKDKAILDMVRHHHESYDGSGYPDGQKGPDGLTGTAILTLADAFDAMVSARAYRLALKQEKALEEIQKGSGKKFDPHIAYMFVNNFEQISSAYQQKVTSKT